MVAIQLFPIFQILAFLCVPSSLTYPIYGTKRFGRSSSGHPSMPSWTSPAQPYKPFVRAQRYPLNYYEMYPYTQDYSDEYYYPQETPSYPVYYPPPRTSKYEVYQAVLPYYYGDRPLLRPGYGYYGYDKNSERTDDLEEELLQDAEREEREDAQPIGQEVLYENEGASDDNLDDVNAAFLQNLIMSQMYKDALNNEKNYYDQYVNSDYFNDEDGYGRWDDSDLQSKDAFQEDEDVKELKQLAKPQKYNNPKAEKKPTTNERIQTFRSKNSNKKQKHENSYNWEEKRNFIKSLSANKKEEFSEHGPVVFGLNDRKPSIKVGAATFTTTEIPTTSAPKTNAKGGQKEEVLMRPATPVRHPFSGQILEMINKNEPERKRTPSVYDTIKHMLDMEKNLENTYQGTEMRPQMRKRIVSSEDSLTHQLSVLKKNQ